MTMRAEPTRAGGSSTAKPVKWNGIDNQRCHLFDWHVSGISSDNDAGSPSPSTHDSSCTLPLHHYREAYVSLGWTLKGPFEAHIKVRVPAQLLGPAFEGQTWDAFVFLTHRDIEHVRLSRCRRRPGERFGTWRVKRCCCPLYAEPRDGLQEQLQQSLFADWLCLDFCLSKPPSIVVPDGECGGSGGMLDAHGSGADDRLREAMGCLPQCTSLSVYFTELGINVSKLENFVGKMSERETAKKAQLDYADQNAATSAAAAVAADVEAGGQEKASCLERFDFYSERSGLKPRMIRAVHGEEMDGPRGGDHQDKKTTTVARMTTAELGAQVCHGQSMFSISLSQPERVAGGSADLRCTAASQHTDCKRPKKRQRQNHDGERRFVNLTVESFKGVKQAQQASVKASTKTDDKPFERERPKQKQTVHISLAKLPAATSNSSSSNYNVTVVLPRETRTTIPTVPEPPDATTPDTRLGQLEETSSGIAKARVERVEQAVRDLKDALLAAAVPLPPPRLPHSPSLEMQIMPLQQQQQQQQQQQVQTHEARTPEQVLSAFEDGFHAAMMALREKMRSGGGKKNVGGSMGSR